MANQNFSRLGNYIALVDERNSNLQCDNLLGLSIAKRFIPSIANMVGADLRTYKIVHKNQFAYVPVTSRNGEKITIALYDGDNDCVVSQAYTVFKIIDTTKLLPEYLMLWFRRPEFDRYARFKSIGSAREVFDWTEMCEVLIPVPPVSEQEKIVSQYQTINRRIRVDEDIIGQLLNCVQSLYRNLFVEDIDLDSLPAGWRMGLFGDLVDSTLGGDWGKDEPCDNYTVETVCLRGADINAARIGQLDNAPHRYILQKNLSSRQLEENDIVMELSGGTPTQSTGRSVLITDSLLKSSRLPFICSNFCRVLRPKKDYELYLYITILHLYRKGVFFTYENSSNGIQNLDLDAICKEEVMPIPSSADLATFNQQARSINEYIICLGKEIEKLEAAKEKFVTVL